MDVLAAGIAEYIYLYLPYKTVA